MLNVRFGLVAFAIKVNVTLFILMNNTVVFICRGRNVDIANVDTYRDRLGLTWTHRDRLGQTGTDKNRQGRTGTDRNNQGPKGAVTVCPCLSRPRP